MTYACSVSKPDAKAFLNEFKARAKKHGFKSFFATVDGVSAHHGKSKVDRYSEGSQAAVQEFFGFKGASILRGGGQPLVSAQSILEEYQQLIKKHGPQAARQFPVPGRPAAPPVPAGVPSAGLAKQLGSLDPGIQGRILHPHPPAQTPEQAMLAKLRANMTRGSDVARSNAAESAARVGKLGPGKVTIAADMSAISPDNEDRQSSNINDAFLANLLLGNPALGDPGSTFPVLDARPVQGTASTDSAGSQAT